MRNMNTLPSAPPSNTSEAYDPFAPNSYQAPSSVDPFSTDPFQSAPSAVDNPFTFDPFATTETSSQNPFGTPESVPQYASESTPADYQASRLGERLREKARPVMEVGRRAVSAVVRLAPRAANRIKEAYQSEYGQKLAGMAREAASDTATSAALAGARTLGERYGVNYESGELTIKKTKLARAAIRFAMNPYGESVKSAKLAGKEAYKAGKQELRSQAFSAGTVLANDALGYARNRYA